MLSRRSKCNFLFEQTRLLLLGENLQGYHKLKPSLSCLFSSTWMSHFIRATKQCRDRFSFNIKNQQVLASNANLQEQRRKNHEVRNYAPKRLVISCHFFRSSPTFHVFSLLSRHIKFTVSLPFTDISYKSESWLFWSTFPRRDAPYAFLSTSNWSLILHLLVVAT